MKIKKVYDSISRRMEILGKLFDENCLFVSQYIENEGDDGTVILQIINEGNGDNGYLGLRRLLKVLEHRVNKNTDFEVSFNLKRKERR